MSDSFYSGFNFNPDYSGSAADYSGSIGGYNIGPQSFGADFFTTPAASYGGFAPTDTGVYTPTFDFASYLPTTSYDPYAFDVAGGITADQMGGNQSASLGLGAFSGGTPYAPPPLTTSGTDTAAPSTGRAVGGLDVGAGTTVDAAGADRKAAGETSAAGGLSGLLGKMSGADITKLLLGGAGGLMQYFAAQKAQSDAAAAAAQYKKAGMKAAADMRGLAQPYLAGGGSQLAMALQGALSPAQMQQYQAGQAKLAQSAARTGGVGAIQTASAEQAIYQQALQNQQTMALELLGPGNELAYKAVMAELDAKQGGLQMELNYGSQASTALGAMMKSLGYGIGSQGKAA